MTVLLHPPPESLEIRKVLLRSTKFTCVLSKSTVLKHSQVDCTRLEGRTLVNLLAVIKITALTKFAGQIGYIDNWSLSGV